MKFKHSLESMNSVSVSYKSMSLANEKNNKKKVKDFFSCHDIMYGTN